MNEKSKKVMLITGGTGSIGSELAGQALSAGWRVILQGSADDSVTKTVNSLRQRHNDAAVRGVVADIKTPGATAQLISDAAAIHGKIDSVVDCLVTGPDTGGIVGPFATTSPDAYLPFAEFSIVYLQQLAFAVLPWLKQSQGCFITLVSDAALFAAPRQSLIGAARAAEIAFIKNLALEIARDHVRANCISLSFVEGSRSFAKLDKSGSERIKKARQRAGLGLPSPADIAPLVLFLSGEGARRITGQVISINGGMNA